jgi:hypothetical protein
VIDCRLIFDFRLKWRALTANKMLGGLVQGARTYDPTSGLWLTPDP